MAEQKWEVSLLRRKGSLAHDFIVTNWDPERIPYCVYHRGTDGKVVLFQAEASAQARADQLNEGEGK